NCVKDAVAKAVLVYEAQFIIFVIDLTHKAQRPRSSLFPEICVVIHAQFIIYIKEGKRGIGHGYIADDPVYIIFKTVAVGTVYRVVVTREVGDHRSIGLFIIFYIPAWRPISKALIKPVCINS